jgi:hypothetical protein
VQIKERIISTLKIIPELQTDGKLINPGMPDADAATK